MQRTFLKYLFLFFIPVVLGYITVELLTANLPMSYQYTSNYFKQNNDSIEVLVLGSSQLKDAINPALLEAPTLNLASGNQHHDTDFKLLKELLPQLKNLKTVILEVSYSHFELPHNGKDFWKNNTYLKYYNLNCFERRTYFKDELLYLAHPTFFSKKLMSHYIKNESHSAFNKFGFDTNNYFGRFKTLEYNEAKIASEPRFKINRIPNKEIFKKNTELFFEMISFLKQNNLNIIICKAPMYKTYLPRCVSEILFRRDSILKLLSEKYPNSKLLDKEEDTLTYGVYEYWNQSHLNPKGAEKFTTSLQVLLDQLP